MAQPLHIRGARVWDDSEAVVRDLYTSDRVLDQPAPGALAVDLEGCTIFPGLINAHDHLELNHYPRSKFREVYDNAHQWGEDMNARLDAEPYKSLRAYPLWDRVFIGGLKNLLCGATTVAHHGPPYRELYRRDFPVRVLRKYGWAHSLHFNTEEEIVRSYRSTPKEWPWFIHLAEGTDEVAAGEYRRLKALGCVGSNTVIVHGVGMADEDIADAAQRIRGLVWCPSTNTYLLSKTASAHDWRVRGRHVALGSDSRLTADGDLLDEMRATPVQSCDSGSARQAVSWRTASMLSCTDLGHLMLGAQADWITFGRDNDYGYAIAVWRRADLALVVVGGEPQIGDPDVMAKFPHIQTVRATLDGVEKAIHIDLARRIMKCKLKEPGLEVDALPQGRRFWFK